MAAYRRGPGSCQGHSQEPTGPGGRRTTGVGRAGLPGGAGWTWRCFQCSETDCSGARGTGATWADLELRDNCSALLQVRRSKTGPEGEGVTLYIGRDAGEALKAIRPAQQPLDRNTPVFGLSARQIGRRVAAAAKAAGLGEGFTGHSGRVGMAQDLAATRVELPALMTAGQWKSSSVNNQEL